jgi:hypothetical protein
LGGARRDELVHVEAVPGVDARVSRHQERNLVQRDIAERDVERDQTLRGLDRLKAKP